MINEKPLGVALIGCGAVSKLYYTPALQELEKHKHLKVKALLDPDSKNTAQIKKNFPEAVEAKEINKLSSKEIDIAIIASPPSFHASQAVQLLKSGFSVLCEKPIAVSASDAELMIEAASSNQKQLAIGHFRRFFPATQTIKKILSLGILGDINSFYFSEGGHFRWPVQSASYFKKSNAHGGVLLDIGVHLIDLMIWWFGTPEEVIYEDDAMGGIEVNCQFTCRFSQGFSGEARLSRDCALPNKYLVEGTKGWLTWNVNDASDKIQIGFKDSCFVLDSQIHDADLYDPFVPGDTSHNFQQSFISQILNLVAAIKGEEALKIPAEEAIKSLRLIESCYQNRKLMPMLWLTESESKRAYQLNSQK